MCFYGMCFFFSFVRFVVLTSENDVNVAHASFVSDFKHLPVGRTIETDIFAKLTRAFSLSADHRMCCQEERGRNRTKKKILSCVYVLRIKDETKISVI